MTAPVMCRGGRACDQPATHAALVSIPTPLPYAEAWEPLCWSHAIGDALQVGHERSRHTLTLCSIGYAVEDTARPLVRYTSTAEAAREGAKRAGYEVLA